MHPTLTQLVSRLVPAALTAAGVMLLGVGLLSYTGPVVATDPTPTPAPSIAAASPSSVASPTSASAAPTASVSPSASATSAVATRVVVPALGIDLPVVRPTDDYPYCDVAMYLRELKQPGEAGATYLYAHAREGMFLPLLDESRKNGGRRMLGMLVQVYTDDDRVHLYEITEVRPVVPFDQALVAPFEATTDQLWLQTSIGPKGTKPKMQVIAMPISVAPADHDQAHPTAKPIICG